MVKSNRSSAGAPGERGRRTGAASAGKVLQVLLSFSTRRPTATVRELAELTGLPLPTTHRYVALLRDVGLVEPTGRAGYQLGWRAFSLGQAARAASGLLQAAEPVMQRLSAEMDETVTLLEIIGDAMVCIGQVESTHFVRISLQPGQPLPLSAGASAKVLLSSVPAATLERHLDKLFPPGEEAARARWESELDDVRRDRHATSLGELDEGIWAASAPLHDSAGTPAALSIAVPVYRADEQRRARALELLTAAAAEVSEQLAGGSGRG